MSVWQVLRAEAGGKLAGVAREQAQWDACHPALQDTLLYQCWAFRMAVRRLGWTCVRALFGG